MTDIASAVRMPVSAGGITRTGFSLNVLTLDSGNLADLPAILEQKIAAQPEVYRQRSFVLDVSQVKDLAPLDYPALQQLFAHYDTYLLGVSGITSEERAAVLAAKRVPIVNSNKAARVREENLQPKVVVQRGEGKVAGEVPVEVPVEVQVKVPVQVPVNQPLTLITRPVRSGETITAPGNSVVVFGSVGSGARIVAAHHIIVFGDIKGGEVYAGSPRSADDPGFTQAFIYAAGKFNPAIVSIAGNYQTAEDMESDPLIGPLQGRDVSVVVTLEGTALHYWQAADFAPGRPRY